MDGPKTKKSKSSNSAIVTRIMHKVNKTESNKKKSKSNVEFQKLEVKKRGVYVEKKSTKASLNGRELDGANDTKEEIRVKLPRRTSRDSKRFLASVLPIISTPFNGETTNEATNGNCNNKKYRSKVLNNMQYKIDNFKVLQSKKEIINTPSSFSVKSDIDFPFSDLTMLDPAEDEDFINNALVREVIEGKQQQENRAVHVDLDPPTLVGEQSYMYHKKLYKSHVNKLANTSSAKTSYDAPIASTISSKVALEIDESVARKLNVAIEMCDRVALTSDDNYQIKYENKHWQDANLINYLESTPKGSNFQSTELPKAAGKRKMIIEYDSRKAPAPKSQSEVMRHRPSFCEGNKKKNLLKLLKEQLRMDTVSFEEPQNIYQALKIMINNKRKQRTRTLSFDKTAKTYEGRPTDCMLKGSRSVISKKPSKSDGDNITHSIIGKRFSGISGHRRKRAEIANEAVSNHSLEVFDFESLQSKNQWGKRYEHRKMPQKDLYRTIHSSCSSSQEEIQLSQF